MGRRSKLSAEVQARIEEAVREGNPLGTAAAYGGISESTLHAWRQRGERKQERVEVEGGSVRTSEMPFLEFSESLTRARADAACRNVLVIQKAATGYPVTRTVVKRTPDGEVVETTTWTEFDWRASAWYLERAFPDRWGKRGRLEHSGGGGGVLMVPTPVGSEEWAQIAAVQQAALSVSMDGADPQ